jgi:hypothetical protein
VEGQGAGGLGSKNNARMRMKKFKTKPLSRLFKTPDHAGQRKTPGDAASETKGAGS